MQEFDNPHLTNFIYSTPGKFILSGEHSVVYGKDAIVATVDLRTYGQISINFSENAGPIIFKVFLRDTKNKFEITCNMLEQIHFMGEKWTNVDSFSSFLEIYQKEIEKIIGDPSPEIYGRSELVHMLYFLCRTFHHQTTKSGLTKEECEDLMAHIKAISFELDIVSFLPISKGLGSSASYLVTVSACLLRAIRFLIKKYFDKGPDTIEFEEFRNDVNTLAFDFEGIFHGKPSGLDNNAVTFGGVTAFNRLEKKRDRLALGFLSDYYIFLIDSGIEKNTKKTVLMIKQMTEDEFLGKPTISIIDSIGLTTSSIKNLICSKIEKKKADESFRQLIKFNHQLLKSLNLSNQRIDHIISICEKYHFPAKITGGGQGGYCVCFIPRKSEPEIFLKVFYQVDIILKALTESGLEFLQLSFEDHGLREEKSKQMPLPNI